MPAVIRAGASWRAFWPLSYRPRPARCRVCGVEDYENPGRWSAGRGRAQNSLFTITADTHEVRHNPEYYVMRHFSKYVRPGAKVLGATSHFNSMAIAFRNPDGTIVVVTQNALEDERPFEFADPADASRGFKATLAPRSFNTFVIE